MRPPAARTRRAPAGSQAVERRDRPGTVLGPIGIPENGTEAKADDRPSLPCPPSPLQRVKSGWRARAATGLRGISSVSHASRHLNRFNVRTTRASEVGDRPPGGPGQAGEVFAKTKPRLAVYSHIVQPDAGEQDLIRRRERITRGPCRSEGISWSLRLANVRHSRIIACLPLSFARSPLLPNHVGHKPCARNSPSHDPDQGVRLWPLSHACRVETRPQGSPMVERRLNGEHHDNAY
jgi:hypothetical protein